MNEIRLKIILPLSIFLIPIFLSCSHQKGKKYFGAELFSKDSVKYGRFEIRMKMASGSGIVSSFFLFNSGSLEKSSEWREIDIEALGCDSDLIQTNIITGLKQRQIDSKQKIHALNSLSLNYNVYTLEWTPDYVSWHLNNRLIRKTTAEENKQLAALKNKYLSFRFNIWVARNILWNGFFTEKSLPAYQVIDWIKYYKYNDKSEPKFELAWTDEFNFIDDTRWGKGNWTFSESKAVFNPQNISVTNNNIVLSLTMKN